MPLVPRGNSERAEGQNPGSPYEGESGRLLVLARWTYPTKEIWAVSVTQPLAKSTKRRASSPLLKLRRRVVAVSPERESNDYLASGPVLASPFWVIPSQVDLCRDSDTLRIRRNAWVLRLYVNDPRAMRRAVAAPQPASCTLGVRLVARRLVSDSPRRRQAGLSLPVLA